MVKFEMIVNHYDGFEMDRKTFDSIVEAEDYYHDEWADNDFVSDHTIIPTDQ